MPQRSQTGTMFSTCSFLCPSFVPLLTLWTWYFENYRTDFDTNWHKWSTWCGIVE